jgi:hypothetical protein
MPSGRSSCRVSWCCVNIEEQRWTRLVQALLGALNSQKSRPEEPASRSGPPLRLLLDGAVDAAPSLTTSSGVAEPARACSWKNAPVSVSSFEPAIRVEQNLAVVLADAPGGDHRLTGWPARSPSAISSNYRLSGIRTDSLLGEGVVLRTPARLISSSERTNGRGGKAKWKRNEVRYGSFNVLIFLKASVCGFFLNLLRGPAAKNSFPSSLQ